MPLAVASPRHVSLLPPCPSVEPYLADDEFSDASSHPGCGSTTASSQTDSSVETAVSARLRLPVRRGSLRPSPRQALGAVDLAAVADRLAGLEVATAAGATASCGLHRSGPRPQKDPIAFQLGVACVAMAFPELAIECLEAAVQAAPDDERARDALATAMMSQGRLEEAIAHAGRAVALAPDDPRFCVTLAWAYWLANDESCQQGLLDRCDDLLGATPAASLDEVTLAVCRGSAHYLRNNLEGAERCFRAALALQPNEAIAMERLCRALIGQGKVSEAQDLISELHHMNPRQNLAHELTALLQMDQEAWAAAVHTIRAGLRLQKSPPLYLMLAACQAQQHCWDEAERAVQNFFRLGSAATPEDSHHRLVAYSILVEAALARDLPHKVVAVLEKPVTLCSDAKLQEAGLLQSYGEALLACDRHAEAAPIFRRCRSAAACSQKTEDPLQRAFQAEPA